MDQDVLEKLKKAGRIAAQCRDETAEKIVAGASFVSILDFCENRIQELGGGVAWAQLSPTTTAAHFCPTDTDNPMCKKGDLLKLDVGVHIDGWIADTAYTVAVDTDEYDVLIEASKEALEAAIKKIKIGAMLHDLGTAQETEAKNRGVQIVQNLCGHTLGQYTVHGGITVPSYGNKDKKILAEGDIVAIEPFTTTGIGRVQDKGATTVFMQIEDTPTRSPHARKLLSYIKTRKGLPFTTRHLTRQFGVPTTTLGLRELLRAGILQEYPPLVEISNAPVAQFEHTILVLEKPIVITDVDWRKK